MGLKIAVVGGGSTYTPELVQGFATREDRLPVEELVLLDVERERLEVVGGLAGRMLDRAGWGGRLALTGRREEALDGASFVVVQLRVGGQAMRLADETLPLEFGCVGQETTGPGGFAKALRTVPVVLELAGLNHLTWERAVKVDGVDRLPELLDGQADWIAADVGVPADLLRTLGAVPSHYLRYYYATSRVLGEQRRRPS